MSVRKLLRNKFSRLDPGEQWTLEAEGKMSEMQQEKATRNADAYDGKAYNGDNTGGSYNNRNIATNVAANKMTNSVFADQYSAATTNGFSLGNGGFEHNGNSEQVVMSTANYFPGAADYGRQNSVANSSKLASRNHDVSAPPNADLHEEFLKLQSNIKTRAKGFNGEEDFIRHVIFGNDFDNDKKYNSKRSTTDFLGFDYSIPPNQRTIQYRIRGRYNHWLDKDKLLEEEELQGAHELSGSDQPLNISDLMYPDQYGSADSYENYYYMIKALRQTEQRYQKQVLNTPDSALVVDGNVAFGRARGQVQNEGETVRVEDDDDRITAFDRKMSTSSLGDIGADVITKNSTGTRKMLSVLAKRLVRARSKSPSEALKEDGSSVENTRSKSSSKNSSRKENRSRSRLNFLTIGKRNKENPAQALIDEL